MKVVVNAGDFCAKWTVSMVILEGDLSSSFAGEVSSFETSSLGARRMP